MRPRISSFLALTVLAIGELQRPLGKPSYTPSPFRKCIVCGKPRYHNNSFCSAECCKQYKAQNNLPK